MVAELPNYFVNERFNSKHSTWRIVLSNWTLHPLVLVWVWQAEHVVVDLAIDESAVVVVERRLAWVLASCLLSNYLSQCPFTFSHLLSAPYIVLMSSG